MTERVRSKGDLEDTDRISDASTAFGGAPLRVGAFWGSCEAVVRGGKASPTVPSASGGSAFLFFH